MKLPCLFCFALISIFANSAVGERISVKSPNGELELFLVTDSSLQVSVEYQGALVLEPSDIGLELGSGDFIGRSAVVEEVSRSSVEQELEPVVRRKRARLQDRYNEAMVSFEGDFSVALRAYDDGVAYRFILDKQGELLVTREQMDLSFPEGAMSFFPEEESIISHNERLYPHLPMSEIDASRFASLPVMVDLPGQAKVLFSEADLYNYPAMYVRGGDGSHLSAMHPNFVLQADPSTDWPDRNVEIVREADYIARTIGERSLPWRLFVVSEDDRAFIESELVYLLSRPLELEETEWIKPGRVAWDWYNANNIYGVDFKSGLDNRTYKYYIDFASKYGIEYVILDEGWSASTLNVAEPNPDIDVPELVRYGAERGVRIILWSLWRPMVDQAPELFDLYKEWGVAGVKIDFMQRSDQYMVEFYERVAREAAKRELLVDYHGSFKPAGLRRALPNVITYEGVKGNENNKWSIDVTPTHNVTIPFTRMVAGPMDYTPGAMANANLANHLINHYRPMSIGTRAHEVAKYVVFESPLQMYCESPSRYLKEHETTEFITRIPSVWDDTVALQCSVGEYAVIARRSGDVWFIGAMTNENARTFAIDLSFIGNGVYQATVFQDGVNTENFAEDYKISSSEISSDNSFQAKLAAGGGWTAILTPVDR